MPDRAWEIQEATRKVEIACGEVTDFTVAIDGGAHIGDWSRALAPRFESVHAFEPDLQTWQELRRLVPEGVETYRAALGDRDGRCRLMMAPKKPDSRSRFVYSEEMAGAHRRTRATPVIVDAGVPLMRLDGMALTGVGLLKLDVEGAEYHALLGAEETIRRCRPVVVIEESVKYSLRFNVKRTAARELLLSWGYEIFAEDAPDLFFRSRKC